MDSSITLLVVAVVIIGVIVNVGMSRSGKRRHTEIAAVAATHGWTFTESDSSYARTWTGPPFAGLGGKARNVVSGRHRGRDFAAFEYSYTTTSSTSDGTATHVHTFAVWTIALPGVAPQPLVDSLRATAPADWRFEGDTMIAFEKGTLEAAAIAPKLDLMSDLLDRIPPQAWTSGGETT